MFASHRWRVYEDNRTWRNRTQRVKANWELLYPELTSAYLRWKYPSDPPDPQPSTPSADTSDDSDDGFNFSIETVNIYTLAHTAHIQRTSHVSAALALVRQGFLGNSPLNPTLAIAVKTLELYRRLRLRKPSFSVEAFAKVICDLYSVSQTSQLHISYHLNILQIPYRRYFRSALGDAFDVYLAILRSVDKQTKQALKHDTPNWRVLNACPPCTYKLEGEPTRVFNRMTAFDGNMSMRRLYQVGDRRIRDPTPFTDTDYLLTPEYVDIYKDEVQSRRGPAVPDSEQVESLDTGMSDLDSPPGQVECTTNFKAAASNSHKTMWGIFEETGWFVSACRHSLVLWFSDMIRTGEL